MTMTPIEMVKLLKKNGYVKIDQNGSHAKFKNFDNGIQVTVAIHGREMLKKIESKILKKTGLKKN